MSGKIRYFQEEDPGTSTFSAYSGGDDSQPIASLISDHSPDMTYTHVSPGEVGAVTVNRHPNTGSNFGDYYSRRANLALGIASHQYIAAKDHLTGQNVREGNFAFRTTPVSESGLVMDHDDHVRPAKENEQLQLFFHQRGKGNLVDGLYSLNNPAAKVSAMTLIGLADLHSRRTTGAQLRPSGSLSPHSLRIVRHLQDSGVIKNHVEDDYQGNDYDFDDAENYLGMASTINEVRETIPLGIRHTDLTDQARTARTHIRNVMGKTSNTPKPKEVNNNPEGHYQPTLWED